MKYSASSIKTRLSCQYLWDVTYNKKREPIDSGSFEINYGRAFHGLLEEDPTDLAHFGVQWSSIIQAHFEAYNKFWEARGTFDEVLGREVPFEFELVPGITLHGYLDAVVLFEGKHYILETKTTGTDITRADYWLWKAQDEQVGIYLLAAKHDPYLATLDIQGVIYDVTRRPSIRKKRGETPSQYVTRCTEWFFDNRHNVFMREKMERTPEQLDDLAVDIMTLHAQPGFAKNRQACYKFRRQCGIYAHCFENEPLSNNELFQVRKRR